MFETCEHAAYPTTISKQNNNDKAKLPSSRIFQVYIAPLSPSFPPGEQKEMIRWDGRRERLTIRVSTRGFPTISGIWLGVRIIYGLYLRYACIRFNSFSFFFFFFYFLPDFRQSTEAVFTGNLIFRFNAKQNGLTIRRCVKAYECVGSPRDSRVAALTTTIIPTIMNKTRPTRWAGRASIVYPFRFSSARKTSYHRH